MNDTTVTADTLAALGRISTDTITTMLLKLAGMRSRAVRGIRPVNPARCRFVGPAFTVRFVPLREDLTDRATIVSPGSPVYGTLDRIPAGAVLMLDMRGDTTAGALGDVLVARLIALGVAAVVADGGMRDIAAVSAMPLAVWCGGFCPPPSSGSLLAADVQQVIGCGGVMVAPGDIVVGDESGVAVIPPHLAAAVAEKGEELEQVEAWIRRRIEKGALVTGLYPPGEATMAAWREWIAQGRPEV
jgi:regulator of RNase E activity RraA